MIDLSGKTAIITGGSRGIGAASVELFAKLGANVGFNYNKNYLAARQLSEKVERIGRRVFFAECDVSDYTEVNQFLDKLYDKLGLPDILVNNAGIWTKATVENITVEQWRKMIQVNLDSIFYFSTLVARKMKENNIKGNIINISSTAGQRGESEYAHYAATKGAIISYTKSLATELGYSGIRVNCIAPGWVKTDMTNEAINNYGSKIKKEIPLGFIPEALDIANGIAFLASDAARAITGEILNINTGSVLCG